MIQDVERPHPVTSSRKKVAIITELSPGRYSFKPCGCEELCSEYLCRSLRQVIKRLKEHFGANDTEN